MEPKHLIRKNGKFLEAMIEEGRFSESTRGVDYRMEASGSEINPSDLSHYGTETLSISYRYDKFASRNIEEPQMKKELFAESLNKARDLGADYALLEGVRFEWPTEPTKKIVGTLNLYVKRDREA